MQTWFDTPAKRRDVFVIGEVAQAHDGSLGSAHAYVDAIAGAGADAVKFQTHIAAEESTPSEPWRVKFSPQDETRYEYWQRMEWTEPQWRALKEHAEDAGLIFLSSPFSVAAVELLDRIDIEAWKVASGELTHPALLHAIAATCRPVLVSTGMSPWSEIDAAMALFDTQPRAVLQCTSSYPCPPEEIGLNVLAEMRQRYGCPVGLSDHSASVGPGIAAVALGAELLEVHVTLSRDGFGPDVSSSLTPAELRQLVQSSRSVRRALRHPVDKDAMAAQKADMRSLFQRSLVARADLAEGHVLEGGDLVAKKPGTGVPATRHLDVLGRRLTRPLGRDELLTEDHLDPDDGGQA